jgi:putative Ca2+/H+ antiporter (TMEM165/GDT1 family)
MKTYLVEFASIFRAELGDKTQLATLVFAMSPGVSRLGVFLAAAAALIISSVLAVPVGSQLERWVAPAQLKLIAGVTFIVIGAWMVFTQ